MLLSDLTIKNFRSFDQYRLDGLARVNLLVGDNNCGKTSVLEAVHILIANGKLECALETLANRDEIKKSSRSTKSHVLGHPDVKSWFHRNELGWPPRNIIELQAGESRVTLEFEYTVDREPKRLTSKLQIRETPIREQSLQLDSDGLASGPINSPRRVDSTKEVRKNHLPLPRHVFVSSNGLKASRLSKYWNGLLPTKGEQDVVNALKLVFPEILGVQFESETRSRADIWIDTNQDRLSASDLGGGVSFLLAIAIGMVSSRSGVMLVDEIDTGLHYTRLADMWRMVIQTAIKLDVQVFATTHSLDCIRGLSEAVNSEAGFVNEVAIFRVDRRVDRAVRFDGEEIPVVVDSETIRKVVLL